MIHVNQGHPSLRPPIHHSQQQHSTSTQVNNIQIQSNHIVDKPTLNNIQL